MGQNAEISFENRIANPPSRAPSPLRVGFVALLLEDEPLIAIDVEMTLGNAGFAVSSVMSCKEANAWLDRDQPDVVIVDIQLRDGRCTDVVARLVEARIPFVIHSGHQAALQDSAPFSKGVWIGKPAASAALVRAVCGALDFSGAWPSA